MTGGAIIFDEKFRLRPVILLELSDEFDGRSSEGVDVLIVITHREKTELHVLVIDRPSCNGGDQGVFLRADVLVFVYEDPTIPLDQRLALRLGFRQIKGMAEEEAAWIAAARGNGYRSVSDVWRRAGVSPAMLERLAEADAFAALRLSRREALWEAKALAPGRELPLFSGDIDGEGIAEPAALLPQMTLGEEVVEDFVALRLSLKAHPLALLRPMLTPGMETAPLPGPEQGSGWGSGPERR